MAVISKCEMGWGMNMQYRETKWGGGAMGDFVWDSVRRVGRPIGKNLGVMKVNQSFHHHRRYRWGRSRELKDITAASRPILFRGRMGFCR